MEFILLAIIIFAVFAVLFAHIQCNCKDTYCNKEKEEQTGGNALPFPTIDGPNVSNDIESNMTALSTSITNLQNISNGFENNTLNFGITQDLGSQITTAISDAQSSLETALTTLKGEIKQKMTIKI
jgi:hypothetical protein